MSSGEVLNIVSLNIEGRRNLELVTPFLIGSQADAVLLQEVYETDLNSLTRLLKMSFNFSPMSRRQLEYHSEGPAYNWGVAILASKILVAEGIYYHGEPIQLPEFGQGLTGSIEPVVAFSVVEKGGKRFSLATTHFPWAPNGQVSGEQRAELINLEAILRDIGDVVLTGDFNTPRGGKIFDRLSVLYQDQIPPEVKTTIDGSRHKAGYLQLVVDGLFTSPKYEARNVQLVDGVSDHWAVTAQILV